MVFLFEFNVVMFRIVIIFFGFNFIILIVIFLIVGLRVFEIVMVKFFVKVINVGFCLL